MNAEVLGSDSNMLVTFLASFLIWIMFFGLWIVWVADGKFRREQVLHALMATVLAWVFAQMIKSLFPSLRPFEMNGNPPLTLTVPGGGAFPSGHASAAFALATTMWLHNKKEGLVFVLVALAIGLGRVLSNVHFPLDIVGGAVLGILMALAIDRVHVYNLLTRRKVRRKV
ncbi:phosphatase PAP2 family protein [Patescibacteria group bacterium]|nr:phosphatase PAP2 family protein [Patescibacteria group bacterium]